MPDLGAYCRSKKSELSGFIFTAKKKTFAATDIKTSLADGSSIYSYRELPWLYVDQYIGNTVEFGNERVSYNMNTVWGLVYYGGTLNPYRKQAEEISAFLKHALMNLPQDKPMRGPPSFGFRGRGAGNHSRNI